MNVFSMHDIMIIRFILFYILYFKIHFHTNNTGHNFCLLYYLDGQLFARVFDLPTTILTSKIAHLLPRLQAESIEFSRNHWTPSPTSQPNTTYVSYI